MIVFTKGSKQLGFEKIKYYYGLWGNCVAKMAQRLMEKKEKEAPSK